MWVLISRCRFHGDANEWIKYNINMIKHEVYRGECHYIIGTISGGEKNTLNYQPLVITQGTLLYDSLQHYFMVRGKQISDALFLEPLHRWIV